MINSTDQQLITEVSRDLLAQLAPQELPLLRATSEAYFKDPDKALKNQQSKDDMLGFGAAEVSTLLTPALLAAVTEVITYLTVQLQASLKVEGAALISDGVKALFTKFRPEHSIDKTPPPLTAEQLAQVRAIALKQARQMKLSDANAKLLADALVGKLATSAARQ